MKPMSLQCSVRRGAVFLDKDGTLVEDLPYNVDPDRLLLLSGVRAGLRALHDLGYPLVVVSNQPGIAKGYFSARSLQGVFERLEQLAQVPFAGFYFCPHHPDGSIRELALPCTCRKPAPGLLQRAARDLGAELGRSWMIGDILNDIEAGRRAGCNTILVANGGETEWNMAPRRRPHFMVESFEQAARIVKARSEVTGDTF